MSQTLPAVGAAPAPSRIQVVKLGGSLLDLPDLPQRLIAWLQRRSPALLLVVGGGGRAQRVRQWHERRRIDADHAHWLAIRAMSRNARELAAALPGTRLVRNRDEIDACLSRALPRPDARPAPPLLDAYRFLRTLPDLLPHSWDVTSDSIAAFAARVLAARYGCAASLVLLKSVSLPPGATARTCALTGLVDAYFPLATAEKGDAPLLPAVEWVNFRERPPASQHLPLGS